MKVSFYCLDETDSTILKVSGRNVAIDKMVCR